jgi:hypothetical protein
MHSLELTLEGHKASLKVLHNCYCPEQIFLLLECTILQKQFSLGSGK